MPYAGTFRNAYVTTIGAQSGNGSQIWTLRKNGADTAIVVTIAAGAVAGVYSDTTHTATAVATDLVDWKITLGGTATGGATVTNVSVAYQ
jgi:hypothetical protein